MRSSDRTTILSDKANWHQIDWAKAQSRVRCIQLKIMNACEQDDCKRVKSLQRKLDFAELQMGYRKARLFRKQRAICPMCKAVIRDDEEINVHHLQPKLLAGKDDIGNLALVHTNCHHSHHALHYARRA